MRQKATILDALPERARYQPGDLLFTGSRKTLPELSVAALTEIVKTWQSKPQNWGKHTRGCRSLKTKAGDGLL